MCKKRKKRGPWSKMVKIKVENISKKILLYLQPNREVAKKCNGRPIKRVGNGPLTQSWLAYFFFYRLGEAFMPPPPWYLGR